MNARSLRRPLGEAVSPDADGVGPRNDAAPDIDPVRVGADDTKTAQLALSPIQGEQFGALYREHFDFVFRNLRRLGVPSEATDDALQEVFCVVLRRIDDYRPGTSGR